jgi:putative Mg2+ transporter-C (MgtC) family protein
MEDVLRTVWQTWREDFSDLPDVAGMTRLVTRLLVAALLGGALGYDRELQGKDAGLRTHMLICMGAAMFVYVPQQLGLSGDALARVVQGVVAGMGFLGGGAILKLSDERRIEGLTTAAGIWLTAAIGIAVGLGRMASATVGAILALIVLGFLVRLSQRLQGEARTAAEDVKDADATTVESSPERSAGASTPVR